MAVEVDLAELSFASRGIVIGDIQPLIDGKVLPSSKLEVCGTTIVWSFDEGRAILEIGTGEMVLLHLRIEGLATERAVDSLGLRFNRIDGIRAYLRNGYQSWDGSFFVEPGTAPGDGPAAKAPTLGFAMTALLPEGGRGAFVLGFTRHDRFQSRFNFGGTLADPFVDVQTVLDRVPHDGTVTAEPLIMLEDDEVEPALRRWSRVVAADSPLPPRIPPRRITGWCSWYNLYAAIDERVILEHLAAAVGFRDERNVPLDIFQIDDGFTPEMGDWLETKPQFPRGMKPLMRDIAAAGFTPGLWIAPFLVGNRSRLYADHPDWVVQRVGGGPLVHMKFYGEFRWHKRSEEYYILDATHPEAAAYMRTVFRTWRHEWGAGYFKTDFMNAGMEYGPEVARWHEPNLSRVEVWSRMASIIREQIGDGLWLGCGCPLWASVGLVDAIRIGRDIGISWHGEYSAESLLRDQLTRNHASGILWQADPDCVLLRDHFQELSEEERTSLLLFAGLAGGVLMTSDKLDDIPPKVADQFAALLSEDTLKCDFLGLASANSGLIVQLARKSDGSAMINVFNPTERAARFDPKKSGMAGEEIEIGPHASVLLTPSAKGVFGSSDYP